ncbi:MAG: helicase-related protein, partial [Oscillospiraceae bacterium]|nr:helicase-related protein [Oscillospiraceae bacterium]
TVDIAVGTHRLLQKDIEFKRLGLLIVDEEQRFGVAHKEKLKQKFVGVDVLTLSATPIPRTLNMALTGIRDMSVIDEPPEDRHPVQTYVVEYDEGLICDAIRRETARGGQVYYLHNRVDSIERRAARLLELMPELKIETAHGRMSEEQLSEVWRRLLGGECDVLVCTTIIETGVDVPNCNTLIVEDADRLGLAQLYQIRGRVGRSARRAFAYFTFRRDKALSEIATKRLSAIKDFTSFGSGFKIAMRDLQIRGAGSVLSARQSGHMQAVGYDAYLKILAEAVDEASGAPKRAPKIECTVDLAVSAYLPEKYIGDNESRIELYKRIAAIGSEEEAEDVLLELRDRFGKPPEEARTLVEVSLIRAMAEERSVYEVGARAREALIFYTDSLDKLDLSAYIKLKRRRIFITPKGKSCITAELKSGERLSEATLEVLSAMEIVETLEG